MSKKRKPPPERKERTNVFVSGHRTAHNNHPPNAATPTVAGTFTDSLSIIFAPSPACLRNTTSAPLLGGDPSPVGGTMLVVPQHMPPRPQPPLAARRPELSYEDLLGGRVSKLCGYVRTDRHVEALLSTTRVAPAARVEKMMFLLGEIVVSFQGIMWERKQEMHLHHQKQKSRVFMCWSTRYTAHGAPGGPQKGRFDHEGAVSVPHDASPRL